MATKRGNVGMLLDKLSHSVHFEVFWTSYYRPLLLSFVRANTRKDGLELDKLSYNRCDLNVSGYYIGGHYKGGHYSHLI